ncbi:mechanosensitive ion channel family protein [Aquibacillus sp. 3ASR75-11]|uniref:Mechanosensitive ion channel family protein n=1 Tax=Terrihalobacillus insolitus TaxID=2950438 RepID=A0A9X3WUR3_9BACI|nr:mechanosensitive ion channel family protein [Terrihalobacillus insolitus]MDC3412759.1 mechanosensitive ion channel family protein [Terrihalobacillus insolitus]MDC3423764.1 mechanosensitive ion channel family protein [Terrihalobacillus insolitus]
MDLFNDFDITAIVGPVVSNGLKIILLIVAFMIASPIGKKVIKLSIERAGKHHQVNKGRTRTLEKLLINAFSYTLIFLFIAMLLGIFEIEIGPLLAGAGILGLAIGFGAQGLVSDVVTGFFLLLEKQIDVDDYVTTGGFEGIVEEVGLRTTKIRSFDGTLNFIPNRNISGVSNHSRGNMRALVDIGISYEENMDEAMKVLQNVCDEFASDERMKEGPDVLGVQQMGSSDVVLRIIGFTENMEQWAVERDLRKRLKEALDTAGIEIPYPHQVNITK